MSVDFKLVSENTHREIFNQFVQAIENLEKRYRALGDGKQQWTFKDPADGESLKLDKFGPGTIEAYRPFGDSQGIQHGAVEPVSKVLICKGIACMFGNRRASFAPYL